MTLLAQDLMVSNLITAHAEQSLDGAYCAMKENGIRHLPVINDAKQLVGIISERDLQRAMISIVCTDGQGKRLEDCEFPADKKVRDYMTTSLVTVAPENSVLYVLELIMSMKISSVLIADKNVMKGIVTTEDLLHLLAQMIREDSGGQYKDLPIQRLKEESWVEMSG